MKVKLRWKKEKAETGLRAVGAGPRPYDYHDGTTVYAKVYAQGGGWRPLKGWYWVAGWRSCVPYKNTCDNLCETAEEAKTQAAEYVKQHLPK